MQKIFLLLVYLNLIFYSFCKLEEESSYDLILEVSESEVSRIGRKGIIAFSTNSSSTFD